MHDLKVFDSQVTIRTPVDPSPLRVQEIHQKSGAGRSIMPLSTKVADYRLSAVTTAVHCELMVLTSEYH